MMNNQQDNHQFNFIPYVPNGSVSTGNPAQHHQAQQQQQFSRKRPAPTSGSRPMQSSSSSSFQHPAMYNVQSSSSHQQQPPLKRRKVLPLPQDVQCLVPESAILNDLQSFEYRLDKILTDKKLRMRQLLTDPKTIRHVLRVTIYTEKQTITTQESTVPVTDSTPKPYFEENWTIHIHGILLNENGTEDLQNCEQYKFTHFLKSMIVELDEELFPVKSDRIIEWHRTHGFEDCEGFQFTRKVRLMNSSATLNQPYPVRIMFGMRDDPPVYHISSQLNELIGTTPKMTSATDTTNTPTTPTTASTSSSTSSSSSHASSTSMKSTGSSSKSREPQEKAKKIYPPHTLNNTLTGVWNYIKLNKLQDPVDKNKVNCDDKLKEIFGCDSLDFISILQQIKQQLLLPEPTILDYQICRTKFGQTFEVSYEIDVNISKPQQTEVEALLSERPLPDVQKYDLQIQKALEGIEAHRKKRDFMLGFSDDPVNFIHKLIASQTRDLLLMSTNNQELEQSRYASFYKTPWIQEAAHRYASKK